MREHSNIKLDQEKQLELFTELRYKNTDLARKKEIRKQLIEANIDLAEFVLRRISNYYSISIKDYRTYAYEGLIYAVDNYKPEKETTFSTYAYPCIKGFIKRAIAREKGIKDILVSKFYKAVHKVEREYGKKYIPGDIEMLDNIIEYIVKNYDITEKEKQNIEVTQKLEGYMDLETTKNYITLDPLDDENIMNQIYVEELKRLFLELLRDMPEKYGEVVRLRYGINEPRHYTQKETAIRVGYSKSHLPQLELKGMKGLHHPKRLRRIKEYRELKFPEEENIYTNEAHIVYTKKQFTN